MKKHADILYVVYVLLKSYAFHSLQHKALYAVFSRNSGTVALYSWMLPYLISNFTNHKYAVSREDS
jgi:hypothetical protein